MSSYTRAYSRAMTVLMVVVLSGVLGVTVAAIWGAVSWATAGQVALTAVILWFVGVVVAHHVWNRHP